MLPSTVAVNSPTASSIRNHLVKQAPWAYLQPMSASPTSSPVTPHFLHHCFSAFLIFVNHHLSSALSQV
ncbi:hypothetical protein Lal_00018632 [Lupinus albus]|nr:hypothetical protein Lal_00018632 [Lupinus albus]